MEKHIQNNYDELKKKSELTDAFIKVVNDIKFDDSNIPKTKKGMDTVVKKLLKKVDKKIKKK